MLDGITINYDGCRYASDPRSRVLISLPQLGTGDSLATFVKSTSLSAEYVSGMRNDQNSGQRSSSWLVEQPDCEAKRRPALLQTQRRSTATGITAQVGGIMTDIGHVLTIKTFIFIVAQASQSQIVPS